MAGKFQAEVDRIVVNTEKRMLMVMQQSLLNAVNEMQTPVAKGGRMRVDTGFLRASGQSSLNGMPTGPSRNPGGSDNWNSGQTEATIGKITFGSVFFFGWTAEYAKYREAYDGFMSATLQNWQSIVDNVVAEARRRFS
ncbi:hypothetical protein [Rhizobium phage RHph_X2_24]|nr:hypothetical protein [Rhizobium phage RHph_X2_24]